MFIKTSCVLFLFLLTFSISCKKNNNTPDKDDEFSFFREGNGLRKVFGILSDRTGLGAFNINQLTTTPDGFIHTAFTYAYANPNGAPASYFAYRKKINILKGDTIGTKGIPRYVNKIYIGQQSSGCLEFGLVPYTDQLVYSDVQYIYGESTNDPNWPRMYFGGGFAKIYNTRQAACYSFSNVNGPNLYLSYYTNEVKNPPISRYTNTEALSASVEITETGKPLAFIALKSDSLLVLDFENNTILASLPMKLFLQYIPSNYPYNHKPTSNIITKRTSDGTKIVGTVFHTANYFPLGNGRMMSTFVYDISTKTLTMKVENAFLNTGFYLTNTEDIDDNGNYYYLAYVANPTVDTKKTINKITPENGITVYKTGFLNGSSDVILLRVVSNKLIIACAISGNPTYSDNRGKGAMVIAME